MLWLCGMARNQYKLFFLLILLLLFFAFSFIVAALGVNIIDLGLGEMAENVLVAVVSFIFVCLLYYHLITL